MNRHSEELFRLQQMLHFEQEARRKGFTRIAGIDEAGRGPLAGPVVAACCYIPEGVLLPGVNDSKQLSPAKRAQLFEQITTCPQIVYQVGIVSHQTIDDINIYQATIQAMLEAVDGLAVRVCLDYLLVDGMNLPHPSIPCQRIVKGDTLSQSIAAASIVAKETRDQLMLQYHLQWPQYGFDRHKGYGTALHLEALEKYGPCPIHRQSFEPVKSKSLAMVDVAVAKY